MTPVMKRVVRSSVVPKFAPRFSTLLDKKEGAEEARYIRDIENRRKEEIRANVERILAMEDSREEKQELVELLAKKDEEQGLIARFGLDDWRFALPVGMMIGIPAVANEVLVLDAELQLTACFILFCSTLYTQVGPMISKSLDEYTKEIENGLKHLDSTLTTQIHYVIKENEAVSTIPEDFKSIFQLTDQLSVAQADVLNRQEELKFRDQVVKKLEALSALEETAVTAIRNRTLTSVKSDVIKSFTTDKKLKEDALNQAIAVLAAGEGGKLGKDIVGEAFSAAISSYKQKYAQQAPGSDAILLQLEKDMKAIATPPAAEGKGGNVFVTHPVM
jgi:hypothetical protein